MEPLTLASFLQSNEKTRSMKKVKGFSKCNRTASFTIWTGMGSAMDISGESFKVKELYDLDALKCDWQKITEDFERAMEEINREMRNDLDKQKQLELFQ